MEVVKYKDSGVAWIGHIPEHWRVSVIKRTTYIKGRIGWQGLTSEEYQSEGKYLLVTGTDFENGKVRWEGCWYVDEERYAEDPYIQLVNNDVLITKDGTIGKIALVENMPTEATLNSGVFVTRPYKNEYSPQFMFWLLNSDLFPEFIEYSKVGTTISHLYQKTFERFSYPLPPLDEQRRIAAYLDKTCAAIDAAIEKKQKQLETLDALRKSIIHKAVTRGLDDSVELKDSGVDFYRLVPRHWRCTKLRYEIMIRNGDFVSDKLDDEGDYPVMGGNGLMGRTTSHNVNGDIVVVGRVGAYCGIAHYIPEKTWISDNALIVESINNKRFLTHLFNALDFNTEANRTAQPVITGTKIKNTYVVIPMLHEQAQIADYIDSKISELVALQTNLKNQITTLQQYRKSLIHECVTGKRRIAEEGFAGHTSKLVLT